MRIQTGIACCLLLLLLLISGCRTAGVNPLPATVSDRPLGRETEKAHLAFHAGYDDEAYSRYRLALARAWELDDAAQIATAAYNLAAASAAMDDFTRARQALAEARAELSRAATGDHDQTGYTLAFADVWLLEAKVARGEGRLADAAYYADRLARPAVRCAAECNQPCCQSRWQRWRSRCATGGISLLGCLPLPRSQDDCAVPDRCQQAAVDVALLRVNLALDSGDFSAAEAELAQLRCAQPAVCEPATRAEIAAAEARLLLLLERPADAADRLDQEAVWLRQSGHLREIPRATSAAAEAYETAGLLPEAADRYLRTARILYGRGERLAALSFLEQSAALSLQLDDSDLQLRAELLLDEIESVVPESAATR